MTNNSGNGNGAFAKAFLPGLIVGVVVGGVVGAFLSGLGGPGAVQADQKNAPTSVRSNAHERDAQVREAEQTPQDGASAPATGDGADAAAPQNPAVKPPEQGKDTPSPEAPKQEPPKKEEAPAKEDPSKAPDKVVEPK